MATGLHVHLHYCCGQLAGIALNTFIVEEDSCCDSHHNSCSAKKGCCSTDDIKLSIEDEHAKASFDFEIQSVAQEARITEYTEHDHSIPLKKEALVSHPPNGPPLYLLFVQPLHYA